MSYTHFSISDRIQLHRLREIECRSITEIAIIMNRAKSTISRELRRNRDERSKCYLPDSAQEKMKERRKQAKERFRRFCNQIIERIKEDLAKYHSPEQIAGRMQREKVGKVSHESIYQMLYGNHQELGEYKKYLRQKQKQRRRKGKKEKRGRIPNRVGIEHRPKIAELKTEMGHWESDTVIGCNHQGVIVTHVDKASKYLLAGLGKSKKMGEINRVTIELFKGIEAGFRKTMTLDNGKEFCGHEELAKELGLECYFANPYHSWERGLNEHTNGLLRQFFPKETNFKIVKEEELNKVVDLINNRPRKSLDYRTPSEVFLLSSSRSVALQI
jgi:IS30 family transposase